MPVTRSARKKPAREAAAPYAKKRPVKRSARKAREEKVRQSPCQPYPQPLSLPPRLPQSLCRGVAVSRFAGVCFCLTLGLSVSRLAVCSSPCVWQGCRRNEHRQLEDPVGCFCTSGSGREEREGEGGGGQSG
jgi:hypothetical protein